MARTAYGRSITFAYLGVALPGLAAVALYPSLIKNLGADRFGALSLLLAVAMFFGSFDFGVGLAVTRYSARFDGRVAARGGIRRLLRHAIALQCAIGLLVGLALVVAHQIWGLVRLPAGSPLAQEVSLSVVYLGVSVPMALVAGVIRCALEGTGRYGVANVLRAPATIGAFAVPIATSFLTTRLDLITLSLLASRLLTTVLFVQAWLRCAPPGHAWARGWRLRRFVRQARVLLSYGGWVMVGVAAGGVIVLGVLDRSLVARIVNVGAVLDYAVPSDIIGRCLLIPAAISSVLLPALTQHTVGSMAGLAATYRRGVTIVAHQAGPVSALLVLNSDFLVGILTHHAQGLSAAPILAGLATGFFVQALAHVPYCGLHAAGAPRAAGLRHLVELPFYALTSVGVLAAGHLAALGWIWAAWALVDLGLLLILVRRIAPQQAPLRGFAQRGPWLWAVIILSAHVLAAQQLDVMWRSVTSVVLAAWFLWQILKIWHTQELFGAPTP